MVSPTCTLMINFGTAIRDISSLKWFLKSVLLPNTREAHTALLAAQLTLSLKFKSFIHQFNKLSKRNYNYIFFRRKVCPFYITLSWMLKML
jgi:hypothetical protein